MPNQYNFNENSTSDDVMKALGKNALNKTIIITGATSGIGYEAAKHLANAGAKTIVILGRTVNEASTKLKEELPNKFTCFKFVSMDLSSLANVKRAAEDVLVLPETEKIDILINNAGIMAIPKSFSKDNIEMQFQVCHVGHQLFTNLLLPRLKSSIDNTNNSSNKPRIVNLSSMAHYLFRDEKQGIFFDDLNAVKYYHPWLRYGQAKLANILHAKHLQKILDNDNTNINTVSLHPGVIKSTNLMRDISFCGFLSILNFPSLFFNKRASKNKNMNQGAANTLFTALIPDVELIKGGYYHDFEIEEAMINPKIHDSALAEKLYTVTDDLIKEKLEK